MGWIETAEYTCNTCGEDTVIGYAAPAREEEGKASRSRCKPCTDAARKGRKEAAKEAKELEELEATENETEIVEAETELVPA